MVQGPHQRGLAKEHVEGRGVRDALEVADLDGAGAPACTSGLGAVDLGDGIENGGGEERESGGGRRREGERRGEKKRGREREKG